MLRPSEIEHGFGLGAPRRQMNGGEWSENGAETGKLRRCTAHDMWREAPNWRARRDRRARIGGKSCSRGFHDGLPKSKYREPSVGNTERVSAQESSFLPFLASSALNEAGVNITLNMNYHHASTDRSDHPQSGRRRDARGELALSPRQDVTKKAP